MNNVFNISRIKSMEVDVGRHGAAREHRGNAPNENQT